MAFSAGETLMSGSMSLDDILGGRDESVYDVATCAPGPAGELPLMGDFLGSAPSGDLFGMIQDVGMGWGFAGERRCVPAAESSAGFGGRTASLSRSGIIRGIMNLGC
jgi:hypothetical protein